MQTRPFLLLLLVTLLAAGAAAYQVSRQVFDSARPDSTTPAFPLLQGRAGEAVTLEILDAAGELRLERGEEGLWVLPGKDGHPADTQALRRLFVELAGLTLAERKTANPARLGRLGLEDPRAPGSTARRLRILTGDGTLLADAIIGRNRPGEGVYLRQSGEDQAWLAGGSLSLPADPLDWMDRTVVTLAPDAVHRIEVLRPDGNRLLAERDGPGQPLAVVAGLPPGQDLTPEQQTALAGLLSRVRLQDVAASQRQAFPAEMTRTQVTTFDGIELYLELAVIGGHPWLRLQASLSRPERLDPAALDTARAFIEALNARALGWSFRVTPAVYEALTLESVVPADAP